MKRLAYSPEYKIRLIEEYASKNISVRLFCKEKGIKPSTFEGWITIARKAGQVGYFKHRKNDSLVPIDVTNEVKTIVEERPASQNTFSLEAKGMKFTFSIGDLRTVMEVIRDDRS